MLIKYKTIKETTDLTSKIEQIAELDKEIQRFMKLNQIKLQVKSDSLKYYQLKTEFSDESSSENDANEIDKANQSLGKSYMNQSSYVDILLENIGLNKMVREIQIGQSTKNIPQCIMNKSSRRSLGLNTSMESSISIKIEKKSSLTSNPFTKYNSSANNPKKEKNLNNHPLRIINTKRITKDNKVANNVTPTYKPNDIKENKNNHFTSYYEDVSEKETTNTLSKNNTKIVTPGSTGLAEFVKAESDHQIIIDDIIEFEPNSFIENNHSNTSQYNWIIF